MESQLLAEGWLDVKLPRGSTDRKLWKAWRRQWISFSAVYPPAAGEPLLQLTVAREAGRRFLIRRGELRMFRSRSRSRPLRTWALLAAGKVLLFLGAESEARAQHWMRSLREGLWPAGLEARMSTVCAYEVSLIDDESTLQSGLLGAYGHLVSNPGTALSLVHPHWGTTLLRVPLSDVQNVLVLREDKNSRSGAFGIVFVSDSQEKSSRMLQFYCEEVDKTVQWIFSKLIAEDIDKRSALDGETTSECTPKDDTLHENLEAIHLLSKQDSGTFGDDFRQREALNANSASECGTEDDPDYENLEAINLASKQYLITSDCQLASQQDSIISDSQSASKQDAVTSDSELIVNKSDCSVRKNNQSNSPNGCSDKTECNAPKDEGDTNVEDFIKFDNSFYGPNTSDTHSQTSKQEFVKQQTNESLSSLNKSSDDNISNLYENIYFLEQSILAKSKMLLSPEYAEVNKSKTTGEEDSITNNFTSDSKYGKIMKANPKASQQNKKDFKNKSQSVSTLEEFFSPKIEVNTEEQATTLLKKVSTETCQAQPCYDPESEKKGEEAFEEAPSSFQTSALPSVMDTTPTTERKPWMNEFLVDCDEPRTSHILKGEMSERNNDDEEFSNHIYDHLTERKGTIYEEIDEGEEQEIILQPPQLPEKPQDAEAQSSFKLLKLSKNLSTVLEEMTLLQTPTSKQASPPKLVHKIKDTSRIMHM